MEPQSQDAWTEPIVIVPEQYLADTRLPLYLIIGLSLLAFLSVSALYITHPKEIYNAHDDDERISIGGFIGGTAESSEFFLIPSFSLYVFYTLGIASVVGNRQIKYKFYCTACVCLATHALGLMLYFGSQHILLLFCGLLLSTVSAGLAFVYSFNYRYYLTHHKKFTIAEWNERAKRNSNLPQEHTF